MPVNEGGARVCGAVSSHASAPYRVRVVFPHDCPGEGVLYGTVKLGKGVYSAASSAVLPRGYLSYTSSKRLFERGSFGGVTPRDTLVPGCETDLPSLPTVRLAQNTDPTQTPPVL